jgi:hypothetical protein
VAKGRPRPQPVTTWWAEDEGGGHGGGDDAGRRGHGQFITGSFRTLYGGTPQTVSKHSRFREGVLKEGEEGEEGEGGESPSIAIYNKRKGALGSAMFSPSPGCRPKSAPDSPSPGSHQAHSRIYARYGAVGGDLSATTPSPSDNHNLYHARCDMSSTTPSSHRWGDACMPGDDDDSISGALPARSLMLDFLVHTPAIQVRFP